VSRNINCNSMGDNKKIGPMDQWVESEEIVDKIRFNDEFSVYLACCEL